MQRIKRTYSGVKDPGITAREIKNREIARRAATEGMVLLKNEEILPLERNQKIAVYGQGIARLIKGGTGSGDVNAREVVSIPQGLVSQGIYLVNQEEALQAPIVYEQARNAWGRQIQPLIEAAGTGSSMGFLRVIKEHPFQEPEVNPIQTEDIDQSDVVVYVISRVSGEGRDRYDKEGDYYLSRKEKKELELISQYTTRIVVLLNTGGPVDLKELTDNPNIKGILYMSQPGMEAGNAVADILTGAVSPSGKLTDTWAADYRDYPNSATFSHNNGNVETEKYEEGIYVGYRYFDRFEVTPQYPFGYGLSYTDFAVQAEKFTCEEECGIVSVTVTNIGTRYSGKEVVQVYVALPPGEEQKEVKRLVGYAKTGKLSPGESQRLQVKFPMENLAVFSEEKSAWMIEKGIYGILAGVSSKKTEIAGLVEAEDSIVVERTGHICPLQQELTLMEAPKEPMETMYRQWMKKAEEKGIKPVKMSLRMDTKKKCSMDSMEEEAREIAEQLDDEELTAMLMGEISKGQDNLKENELVESGIYVPGAAGETSGRLEEKYGIPAISMADGPAGLRVMRHYDVDRATGKIYSQSITAALESGLFAKEYHRKEAERYYMYATAIPIGTMLAQTWNTDLVEEIGTMIGTEMKEFGISWWLAPGMNIHRNPLCGRNFEYYSEDPILSGMTAAALIRGVQKISGAGAVIKHFAANNQEDNRLGSDSVMSEKTLREIYLRGFEIAVRGAKPVGIMNSYNKINGIHTDNSYDLDTVVVRKEWGFQGIIMTDWTSTTEGDSIAYQCAMAGCDLIMPGHPKDVENIRKALKDGRLERGKVVESCARLIKSVLQSVAQKC